MNDLKIRVNLFEQYLFMKINRSFSAFVLLIVGASCIHLRHQEKIYDNELYLSELKTRQDKLFQDLNGVQKMYKQMDKNIFNAGNDSKLQLSLLQEGLADERDSLYSISQYLNLPFNERSCQCFNFTEELQLKLKTSVNEINESIIEIQKKTEECADCAMVVEIKNQILQQKNYLRVIQETLNATCCTVYQTKYLENLNATNWMYGNQTETAYQESIRKQKELYAQNDTLAKICPLGKPFPTKEFDACMSCGDASMIYNLKSRQCTQCPVGKIFNYGSKTCDYNINCPIGTKFNQKTVLCEKIMPAINDSLCPPKTPIWNPQVLGCFRCPSSAPYFNEILQNCTSCPQDTTYHPETSQCVHQKCNIGQIYNQKTRKCQQNLSNITTSPSNSNCPPLKPFWDKNSLSCSQCPVDTPYFNLTSKNCESCPKNSSFDSAQNKCLNKCPSGQIYNSSTNKCQAISVNPVKPGENIGLCPPDQPIWDSQSKSCGKCRTTEPYWNDALKICEKCPNGQKMDDQTLMCVPSTQCASSQVYNNVKKICESSSLDGTIGLCPPNLPYYNKEYMNCQQCPIISPYFYQSDNKCHSTPLEQTVVSCSNGQIFDNLTKKCIENSMNGGSTAKCPPQTPIWNTLAMRCQVCQTGLVWDANKKACFDEVTTAPQKIQQCPFNSEWNSFTNSCKNCQLYQKYLEVSKTCSNFCQPGEIYNSNYGQCQGTISRCPIGLVFNTSQLRCVCKQGKNYRYMPESQKCEEFCEVDQEYDSQSNTCTSRVTFD